MYANTVANNLIFSTIRIELPELDSIGTGFFYSLNCGGKQYVLVVTNNHVLPRGNSKYLVRTRVRQASDDSSEPTNNVRACEFTLFESDVIRHPDPSVDLCCFDFSKLKNQCFGDGFIPFIRCFDSSIIPKEGDVFDAIEEVVMVGYPSGIYDEVNCLPVSRRGITASKLDADFGGQPIFLVDIAVFPGSSGSPIVILNPNGFPQIDKDGNLNFQLGVQRIVFVGVLFDGFYKNERVSDDFGNPGSEYFKDWIHLGEAVKSQEVLKLEEKFKDTLLVSCPSVLAIPTGSF